MRIRALIFFILIFTLSSCGRDNSGWDTGMQNIFRYALEIKKKSSLQLEGFGGSMPDGIFLTLDASFDLHKNVDIEEARELIVKTVEEFVVNVNQDNELRKHLVHYPFTYKDVEVGISFSKDDGNHVINNYIAYVSTINGNVTYTIYDEKTETLKRVLKEPYLEALAKVSKE